MIDSISQELDAKINPFSLKSIFPGILSQQQEGNQHVIHFTLGPLGYHTGIPHREEEAEDRHAESSWKERPG